MSYEIVPKHSGCPESRPIAVVKQGGGKPLGCHDTNRQARDQQKALTKSEEPMANNKAFSEIGYLEIGQMRDGRTRELNERFLVMAANIISNDNIEEPIGALHVLADEYLERLNDWQAG